MKKLYVQFIFTILFVRSSEPFTDSESVHFNITALIKSITKNFILELSRETHSISEFG